MSTLSAVEAERPPRPAHTVVLEPSAFASTWAARPRAEVCLGIRCLSHRDVTTAQAEAAKEAVAGGREGETARERYNEALMAWCVGFSATDPNDARKPYFQGDEGVRLALTPETLRRLWDETETAHLASSPIQPEATDEDLDALRWQLGTPEALAALDPRAARRVRRLLRYCLDELTS